MSGEGFGNLHVLSLESRRSREMGLLVAQVAAKAWGSDKSLEPLHLGSNIDDDNKKRVFPDGRAICDGYDAGL